MVKKRSHFNNVVHVAFSRLAKQFQNFDFIERLIEKIFGILDYL